MNQRFTVTDVFICPIHYKGNDSFEPDFDYPKRRCVVDRERGIVVDVKTKLKYDYIETMSFIYFLNESHKKIKNDKRVGIYALQKISPITDNLKEIEEIITRLKNGEDFVDGNDVLDNKQYLESIKEEYKITAQQSKKNRKKVK